MCGARTRIKAHSARPPSARPGRLWSDGLLRLDRGVEKTIAALNQFFQPLGEAGRRSAIDQGVIKADRQTEIVPDGDVPVNHPRLLANAAHRQEECPSQPLSQTCPLP